MFCLCLGACSFFEKIKYFVCMFAVRKVILLLENSETKEKQKDALKII